MNMGKIVLQQITAEKLLAERTTENQKLKHQLAEAQAENARLRKVAEAIRLGREQVGKSRGNEAHVLIMAWGRVCSAMDDAALAEGAKP